MESVKVSILGKWKDDTTLNLKKIKLITIGLDNP